MKSSFIAGAKLKGRSSRRLQQEFPKFVEQTLLGASFWAIGFEYWSTGNITDKMVNEYLEHHRKSTLVRFKNLWNYSS